MPSLQCAAFRAFATVIPGTWTSTATATLALALAFGICDCCDYTIPGNGHSLPCHTLHFGCCISAAAFRPLHFGRCISAAAFFFWGGGGGHGYSNSKKWASSTLAPPTEFRENSFVTKDCCIPGNRHQLPCHAVQ